MILGYIGICGYCSMFVAYCLFFLHHEVWQSLGRPNTSANASASRLRCQALAFLWHIHLRDLRCNRRDHISGLNDMYLKLFKSNSIGIRYYYRYCFICKSQQRYVRDSNIRYNSWLQATEHFPCCLTGNSWILGDSWFWDILSFVDWL